MTDWTESIRLHSNINCATYVINLGTRRVRTASFFKHITTCHMSRVAMPVGFPEIWATWKTMLRVNCAWAAGFLSTFGLLCTAVTIAFLEKKYIYIHFTVTGCCWLSGSEGGCYWMSDGEGRKEVWQQQFLSLKWTFEMAVMELPLRENSTIKNWH
jgi:hypothetical protein